LTLRHFFRVAIIGMLCLGLSLSTAAAPGQLQKAADAVVVVGIVVAAAVVIGVVLLVHNAGQNRTVTGCVTSSANGLTITNEKDKRVYALTGNLPDVKPDERMKLQLKKVKDKSSNMVTWQTVKVTKDFGVCQP